MDERIEILDVEENEKVKTVLDQEALTRENILKSANQALENQSGNMMTYTKVTYQFKKMREAYLLLKAENENLEQQIQDLKKIQKKRENEVIQLRLENEQNKKKRSALQSLLQVVLNVYGIHEIIEILGISYTKLKEYLED